MSSQRIANHFRVAALIACLSMPLASCGLIFSHAPPVGHEQMNYFTCTEGNTAPVLDLVWGGLNVLGALAAASDQAAYENPGQIMAVGVGWGVVSGLGAVSGFRKSAECRAAKRLLAERLSRPRGDFTSVAATTTLSLPVLRAPSAKPTREGSSWNCGHATSPAARLERSTVGAPPTVAPQVRGLPALCAVQSERHDVSDAFCSATSVTRAPIQRRCALDTGTRSPPIPTMR